MKIYFAGAIRGGREESDIYNKLITYLTSKWEVLTEHVGTLNLSAMGETKITDREIFNRDLSWLQSSDVMIAEVTIPSLGVGYELGIAEKLNLPILCLYRPAEKNRLSAMVNGNEKFHCEKYQSISDAQIHINNFINRNINNEK
tara:strand:+ start:1195 stop:1626 length:432 start_codon:yes stop_codon:yes gene_type:complete